MKISFFVVGAGPNYRRLRWSVDLAGDKLIKGFNLFFKNVINIPFKKLNTDIIDGHEFKHIVTNYSKFPRGYYYLEVIFCDGTKERSQDFNLFNITDLKIMSIQRRDLWELLAPGVPLNMYFTLFQKRSTGTPCPKCSSSYRIGNVQFKCPICFGTGYKSGYYFPTFLGAEYLTPFQEQESNTEIGKMQESNISLKTTAVFAYLRFGDVLREMKSPFRLFVITSIVKTDAQHQPMTYNIGLKQVESHHPLYMMEVPNSLDVVSDTKITYLNIWKIYDKLLDTFKKEFLKLPGSELFTEDNDSDTETLGLGS